MPAINWAKARALSAARPQPIRWLVDEIIPADTVTLISSQSGTGKSMIALHLALCLASGIPWLGVHTQKSNIAYWDQDNPDDVLTNNRICALARGLALDPIQLADSITFRANGPLLHRPDEVASLGDYLHSRSIAVLFVDTIAAVNPWGEGEDFSKIITEGLMPLISYGVTPIALHHMGKPVISEGIKYTHTGINAPRGHSSLAGSIGAAYNLEDHNDVRVLTCAKPRYGRQPDIRIVYDENSVMGLPDWIVTIKSEGVRLSQANLTHLIQSRGWQSYSSRKLVQTLAKDGFAVSQSTATRALSESKR